MTSLQDDTVTVKMFDEDVSGVIYLGERPLVGAVVEVETRGDLLVIPFWYEGPLPEPETGCEPGPWVTVDLADVTIADLGYTTATYTGGKIVCTHGLNADLGIPGLILDHDKVYDIEITCELAAEPQGLRSSIYTSAAFTDGDGVSLWDSYWYFIRNSIDNEDVAIELLQFGYQVSPEGWEDPYGWNNGQDPAANWEGAFAEGAYPQERLVFETRTSAVVTQIRWRESCLPEEATP